MNKGLCFIALAAVLLSACGLKKEEGLAQRFSLRMGATGYTVSDSTFFEKKDDHNALVVFFREPTLKSPELNPVYFAGKTAAAFADSLAQDATNYEYLILKLSIKGLILTKRYSMKTLLDAKEYYKLAENFLIANDKSDTTFLGKSIKPGVLSVNDLVKLIIAIDDQKFQYGEIIGFTVLGFEESYTEETEREVMNIRLGLKRQNTIAEVYDIAFDKADKKIVGVGWDLLTAAPAEGE